MLWLIPAAFLTYAFAWGFGGGGPAGTVVTASVAPRTGQYWRLYYSLSRALTPAEQSSFETLYSLSMTGEAEIVDGTFREYQQAGLPEPRHALIVLLHYTHDSPPLDFHATTQRGVTVKLETATKVPADYKEAA